MIKRLLDYKLIFLLIIFPLLGFSQSLDHVLGEVIFQLEEKTDIHAFTNSIQENLTKPLVFNNLKEVSSAFRVWKITFDHNRLNEFSFLESIRRNTHIQNAQFNYFLDNRTIPNDPGFFSQWYLRNLGQSGGFEGVDLDTELAWDQTTGGVSFSGDTIVVCIIDERFSYNHIDLQANVWINHNEIPNNGIDDDNNNFVDDYYGWNVESEDDEIANTDMTDFHGSAVAGIAGAVGNNSVGVTGVNWQTKLMLVSRGYNTSDAIAAYSYPFENRKLYNQTQGQSGAFVVVTNSSFGVNFGTPDDAPLWCAMFDSLGSVGILSAAATTNSDINVDVEGDLPTTCTSDYLITTTSVDQNDEKISSAGYGSISIDLAAFGQEIFSTKNDNTYGLLSGTSVAAPQIAGTIGLLHTAPCPSFAAFAKNNPAQAALQLKGYILDGVEPNASLEGITLTGGRLNTNNSLELLMDECDFSGCFAPYSIAINEITSSSVIIDWLTDIATMEVNLRYRVSGTSNWININEVQSPLLLDNLSYCTLYEFQLQSVCDATSSAYSASFTFQTDGCCSAPQGIEFSATNNSISIAWEEVTAAVAYYVRYRVFGSADWEETIVTQNYITVPDLEECQYFEFTLSTFCSNVQSSFTDIEIYSTIGCGACIDQSYCNSSGVSESILWINEINIANLSHLSGQSANGYSDFTNQQSVNLIQGFVHEFEILTDFEFFQIPGSFMIWIDFDQNGVFEENELLYESASPEFNATGILYLAPDALLGSTRMRVSFMEENYGPCGNASVFGEVEDYCVFVSEPSECLPPVNFQVETNENSAQLTWSGNLSIDEYQLHYRPLGTTNWNLVNTVANNYSLNGLNFCSDYEYFITSICDGETSVASPIFEFTTKGCGVCLDADYCDLIPGDAAFEWIESVFMNAIENTSGSNDGYQHFIQHTTDLYLGESYNCELSPGFSTDLYDEVFTVWIDFNQDGSFEGFNEKVMEEFSIGGESVIENITIPLNAITGSTRMRVSMKYAEPTYEPCEGGYFGEIEEYCINIFDSGSSSCQAPEWISYFGIDSFSMEVFWPAVSNAVSYEVIYRADTSLIWNSIITGNTNIILSDLECISYEVKVNTICEEGISPFTEGGFMEHCNSFTASQEVETLNEIILAPNPFNGQTTATFESQKQEELTWTLYSGIGHLIQHNTFVTQKGTNTFDIRMKAFMSSGLYFLKIEKEGQLVAIHKLIYQAP